MAHIDELVRKVTDPVLREALAAQVRMLTDRKEFGLVFQQHLPETVRLPQQQVRRGDLVEFRNETKGDRFRVIEAKASEPTALIVQVNSAGEVVGGHRHEIKSDLVVVKQFGEPIYPGLRQVGEAGTAAFGQPTHVVINGENFHALQALEYTHKGKVDLIYIDPPYNTGNADWKYNDRYVDGQDAYRHSKWLSFMERRLHIAKSLLSETGVIVFAIDDNEHHRLRMLADQVFGEANFLTNITWQGGVNNDARFGGGGVDYQLIYAKSKDALIAADTRWKDLKLGFETVMAEASRIWEKTGGDLEAANLEFRRWWKANGSDFDPGMKLYNRIDAQGRPYRTDNLRSPNPRRNLQYDLPHPLTGEPVKMHPNGWVYSRESMQQKIQEGRIEFGTDHTTTAQYRRYLDEVSTRVPENSFKSERLAGSKHLERLLGDRRFPFPKDHEVLMRWFRMIAPSDAVIVDFFAGSGTTAEAVIRLNAEDGGTRQCILVTNNELSKAEDAKLRKQGHRPGDGAYEALGVFHHVTKPRVSTVLTGLREDGSRFSEGIGGQTAAFFDLTYEDENLVALGRKFEAVAPLLWLRAGATGTMVEKIDEAGFSVPSDANYAVIFDTDSAARAIKAMHDGIKTVFVVTDSDSDFRGTVGALPRRLQSNAQRLYSSYLRSFEINRG